MSDIRIKVGASLDRSTLTVFNTLVDSAKRARSQIANELGQAGRIATRAAKDSAREQERAAREATRTAEREARKKAQAEKEAARETEREVKKAARAREKAEIEASRAAIRELRLQQAEVKKLGEMQAREATRAAKDRADLRGRAFGAGISLAGRAASSAIRFGAGVVSDLVRGAGVQSVGENLGSALDINQRATILSNQAYQPGQNARVDPRAIADMVREQAIATGTSTGDVMGGFEKFVAKTGDLDAAKGVMDELAKLAKATGASLEDMADAAADVSNNLGNVPDKGQAIAAVMKQITAQGKVGAIEIKDFASRMAQVAAAASQFEGDPTKNIAQFGALAQFARQHGTPSAAGAATAVGAFQATFGKGARLDAFQKFGVKTEGADGKVRNAEDIIYDALAATKGDKRKMGEMFASSQAQRITDPFRLKFSEEFAAAKKGGLSDDDATKKAIAETREEFGKLKNATMAQAELEESFAASLKDAQSQANIFNAQLEKSSAKIADALLPALVSLAPMLEKSADAVADWVKSLTGRDLRAEADVDKAKKQHEQNAKTEALIKKGAKVTPEQLEIAKQNEQALADARDRARTDAAKARDAYTEKTTKHAAREGAKRLGLTGVANLLGEGEGQAQIQKTTAQEKLLEDMLKETREQNKHLEKIAAAQTGTDPKAAKPTVSQLPGH